MNSERCLLFTVYFLGRAPCLPSHKSTHARVGLYAASPRHKTFAQSLQLWAFRCYPSRKTSTLKIFIKLFNFFYASNQFQLYLVPMIICYISHFNYIHWSVNISYPVCHSCIFTTNTASSLTPNILQSRCTLRNNVRNNGILRNYKNLHIVSL